MYRKLMFLILLVVVMGFGARPVDADLEDGLVAYYQMNETDGEIAADASGNGNDGTLTGPMFEWVPGYDGGALGCNAPGDEEVADALEFATTGMSPAAGTVCVWGWLADPQPMTRGRYFFGHTAQGSWADRIQIYMQEGNTANDSRVLDLGLGGAHAHDTNIMELPLKEWLHVALTWDNGAYAVYVDGDEVSSGAYTGLATIHPIANFGNDGSSTPYEAFGGRLDEARVYNRALSAAEVKEIVELPAEPRITAWNPSPADGAVDVQMPLMQWTSLDTILLHDVYFGTDPNLGPDDLVQSHMPGALYFHLAGVTPGQRYYWRVDEVEMDMTVHTGTVWTFLAMPYTAYLPDPADGASIGPSAILTWLAGMTAAEHHVYFSSNFADVNDRTAAADKGTTVDPNFAPGPLLPLTTYYWRVDETSLDGSVRDGDVWSFTTASPLDDFEIYTDEVGQRAFEFWVDGIGFSWPEPGNPGNGSNAAVGHDVWTPGTPYTTIMEMDVVHSPVQSMPVDYNNAISPYFSEIERTWAARNWTAGGADSLVLHVCGLPGNGADPLQVELRDNAGRTAVVPYADATATRSVEWIAWEIPFSEFADVNAAAIVKMIVRVGDRVAPAPGGAGTIYFDDFWLTKAAATK
ncbi:MAG: LamG domain-containing protein [Sedimentisphaerales bacterium]|nr:LamG domain-containing protein [Sedimentisphaerales bacterium]